MKKIKSLVHELSGLMMVHAIFTIIFGIVARVWPGITLVTLGVLVAVWLFINGIFGTMSSIFMRKDYENWILRLMVAFLQLGVGAYLVQRPEISVSTFVLLIGITFIVQGVVEMGLSLTIEDSSTKLLGLISGVLAVVAGVVIWRYPVEGSLAFVWVLGLFALISGTMQLVSAVKARNNS